MRRISGKAAHRARLAGQHGMASTSPVPGYPGAAVSGQQGGNRRLTSAPSRSRAAAVRPRGPDPLEVDPAARWGPPMLLAVQALLGLHMISRPVSMDETTYIDAGRAEIAHWLHGAAVPGFAGAFSGAPVIYPPLSATAAAGAGLTGARLLSLACMLAATALLFSAVRQLFGAWPAVVAGALFVTTASAQYLSVLATYDAMSLMLLALAARCAVAAGESSGRSRWPLTLATIAAMTAANATGYPSALWDPAVIALIALTGPGRSLASRVTAAAGTAGGTIAALGGLAVAAGPAYRHGILFSTVNRTVNGGHPAVAILGTSAILTGCLAALAVMGATVLTASARGRAIKILGWLLAATALLAPAEQARIGVVVSLFKHIGYGAWFAAIPAAYGLARLAELAVRRLSRSRRSLTAALVIAFLTTTVMVAVTGAVTGIIQADDRGNVPPPYSAPAIYQIKQLLLHGHSGLMLADSPSELAFSTGTSLNEWVNTFSYRYRPPGASRILHGRAAYLTAIKHRIFGYVILRGKFLGRPVDQAVFNLLKHHGRGLGYAQKLPWRMPGIGHGSDGKRVYVFYRKSYFQPTAPVPGSSPGRAHSSALGR